MTYLKSMIETLKEENTNLKHMLAKVEKELQINTSQTKKRTADLLEANASLKREIGERKGVEKSLREQTRRNEIILETAMDGFHIINMQGYILKANRSAARISGYTQEEMMGMHIFELGTRKTLKEMQQHLEDLVARGYHRFETQRRHKSGRIIDLEVSTTYVKMGRERFIFSFFHDIRKRKQEEEARKEKEAELEIKSGNLEEMNTALKVLLRKRSEDQAELEANVVASVRKLILPFIKKLQGSGINGQQEAYVRILESNLMDIVAPFARKLTSALLSLTPTELQVANLVKQGQTTKEIAALLNLGDRTIESHRKNIRSKLGLRNTKTNMQTYLATME